MRIRVRNSSLAFLSAVTQKVHRPFVQEVLVSALVHNVGSDGPYRSQSPVVQSGIYFHPARIYHRTQQSVFRQIFLIEQHRHAQQFQRRDSYQLQTAGIADAFGHRHTDTQSRIRPRPLTHCHRIERNSVIVDIRDSFVHKNT